MLRKSTLLGSLALGLTAGVSANPLAYGGLKSTLSSRYSNSSTTTTSSSVGPVSDGDNAAGSIPGAADDNAVNSASGAPTVVTSSSAAAGLNPSPQFNNFDAAAVPQGSSPAGFTTVVVTETVPECTLGASSPAPTNIVSGQAPFAAAASPSSTSATYAASTLLPAVHWNHPVDDIQNLAPSDSSELYYSAGGVSDPSVQHLFASVSTTLSYDCVVLDHSIFVSSTTCSEDGILVTFTSTDAFSFAANSWSAVGSKFVLVTYTDGCHGESNEQRTFWLIDSIQLQSGTNSILAVVKEEIATEDAMFGVDMVWGTWYPSTGSTNSIGSGSGSSGSYSPGSSGLGSAGLGSAGLGSAGLGSSTADSSTAGSSTSGSSTSGSSIGASSDSTSTNGSPCGAAPSSVIDGLPAVDCGDANFDANLDSTIGYLDFDPADYASSIEDFAPGIDFTSEVLNDDETQLQKRGFFWDGPKAVVHAVVAVATAPITIAKEVIKAVPVLNKLVTAATEFDPSISGQQDFNFGPDASATSPWGQAAQIYAKTKTSSSNSDNTADITIYCVDCGVKGHAAMSGQAKWNLVDGLHGLNAAINANLRAGVHIGLVANAAYSDTKSKELIRAPLPEVGVAIPKLFSAGIYLSVDAVSTVTVTATGQALIGVVMTIPNFQANLNLFDQAGAEKSGVTGLTPTFEKRFEASGKVSASLQLALPIAINVGIEVPAVNIKRSIALIEQPSIYGNLTVAASTSNVAAASDTCNNGIEYFANLQNDVKFDFLGLKTFTLNHYDSPPLLQGCKTFGSSSSTDPASGADTSAAPAAASSDAPAASSDTPAAASSDTLPADASIPSAAGTSDAPATDSPPASAAAASDTPPADTSIPSEAGDSDVPAADSSVVSAAGTSVASGTEIPTASNTETFTASDTSAGLRRSIAFTQFPRSDNGTVDSSGDEVFANEDEGDTFTDTPDTSDQTDGNVEDDATNPDGTEFTDNANQAFNAASTDGNEDGVTFTSVHDINNTFALTPGIDGNLYAGAIDGVGNGTGLFAQYDTAIVGDDGERLLQYFPGEMAVYNASRIRLSYEDQIPKTADVITLVLAGDPVLYYAVDSKQDVYSLVLCNFSNDADSKVFIVKDQSGVDSLEKNINTRYTVTGAPVTECYGLAMVPGVADGGSSGGDASV